MILFIIFVRSCICFLKVETEDEAAETPAEGTEKVFAGVLVHSSFYCSWCKYSDARALYTNVSYSIW